MDQEKIEETVEAHNMREWTKRLGQRPYSMPGDSTTLCGKPMLGNNYARHLDEEHKTTCEACSAVIVEGEMANG